MKQFMNIVRQHYHKTYSICSSCDFKTVFQPLPMPVFNLYSVTDGCEAESNAAISQQFLM
jgi:hypothetical protein